MSEIELQRRARDFKVFFCFLVALTLKLIFVLVLDYALSSNDKRI